MTVLPHAGAATGAKQRDEGFPLSRNQTRNGRGFRLRNPGHGHTMAHPGPPTSARMLAIYLRHHVAASRGGVDLFRRAARDQLDEEARRELRLLAAEVAEDRDQLLAVLRGLDVPRPAVSEWLVGIAETVGRLKPNGTLLRRSPLSDVMELDAMCTAVEAKRLGWVTLRLVAEGDLRLNPSDLDVLVGRAADQRGRLEQLRRRAVVNALAPAGSLR